MNNTKQIEILSPVDVKIGPAKAGGINVRMAADLFSTSGLVRELAAVGTPYVAVCTQVGPDVTLSADTLMFMADWLEAQPEAAMVYADYVEERDGRRRHVVLNDAPEHVARDTFDFGLAMMMRTADARKAMAGAPETRSAAIYALTLGLQTAGTLAHSNMLSGTASHDTAQRDSGQRQFDYVDPRNAQNQKEREEVFTHHLKVIGAAVEPARRVDFCTEGEFAVEASVIIPVKNRVGTVADAVRSALDQQTDFAFNVIVVDNHSTDGTTEVLAQLAAQDPRVVHLVPEQTDLGIGGCWNHAVASARCGRFAVQLDSDDLYSSPQTLATVAAKLRDEKSVLVVGSYKLVDFALEELPPGVIDHREWTDDNGPNNIVRINGMGAPRAFSTLWLRQNPFPNVSYGEDYAAVLCATRQYRVARIYDVLYLCRRWQGNSDAGLTPEKEAAHNAYKDGLRSAEIEARIKRNRE